MAPNAELRQRRAAPSSDGQQQQQQQQQEQNLVSVKSLKPNEVCIDGVVYDLNSFVHPGGESIGIFGGNDVTVAYKMIHPYHTAKHLEKMTQVGTAADFSTDYKFDTPFEQELKREVFKIVRRGREFGTTGWYARAFFYVGLFFALRTLWVIQGSSILLAIAYGVSQSLIGLNVQHDANHGASSKNPVVNNVFGLGADMIGGSKWLWMQQHWTHHAYTNDEIKDPDGKGAEPFMLFNNYKKGHPARKWIHKFQAFFYGAVLAGYWLSSVFNPEVFDLRQRGAQGVGMKMDSDYTIRRRKWAILFRLEYLLVNVVSPFFHHGPLTALGHILLMGIAESLALGIPFSLSHNFEEADRDPLKDVREKGEPVCWYKSQVETSCTYGGFISGALTGGLNFQVEHHLFPRMSSAWYPYIAPTVRDVCKKHNVRYVYFPWIWQNWISTIKYMNTAGTGNFWKGNPLKGDL